MLHDLDALKKAHEASLADAIESNRLTLSLPLLPKRVSFATTKQPWVTYEVDTLTEALDILKLYPLAPWVIAKDGSCTVVNTWAHIEDRYNVDHPAKTRYRPYVAEHTIADGAPYFDCQQGVGFGSSEMEFFTTHDGKSLKVVVTIKQCPIRVRLLPTHNAHSCRNYYKEYPPVPGAKVIQWGYGEDCATGTYWFPNLECFWSAMSNYLPDYPRT